MPLLSLKIQLSVSNPSDIRASGLSQSTGANRATFIAKYFASGTFTNQIHAAFGQLNLVVTDLRAEHQLSQRLVIAQCNVYFPLYYVDFAIPGNGSNVVDTDPGNLPHIAPCDHPSDVYFYRDLEGIEKEESLLMKRQRKNLRVNVLFQLLRSLLLNVSRLRLQTGLKVGRYTLYLFNKPQLMTKVLILPLKAAL